MQLCVGVCLPRRNDSLESLRSKARGSATVAATSIRTETVHLIVGPVAVSQELRRAFPYCVIFRGAVFPSLCSDAPDAQEFPWPGREFPLANPPAAPSGFRSFCLRHQGQFFAGK